MMNFNEIKNDIIETINENREVTILKDNLYYHFYKEKEKIISCNKDGYKEKEFNSLNELFNEIGINQNNYKDYNIEMY